MNRNFFIQSSVDGHCFRILAIVNCAAINIDLYELLFWFPLDKYSEVQLLGKKIYPFFNILRDLQTVFHSGCTLSLIHI